MLIAAASIVLIFLILCVLRLNRNGNSNASAPAPLLQEVRESFARGYELKRVVAVGGMGEVYEAFDPLLRRRVAIKRPALELRQDAGGRKLFLREARIVAALRHPNIVEIISVIDEGMELYIVFEYIEGKTLDELVVENGRLNLEQARLVLRQIAPALDYSHSRHVRHRDLKLSNIMLDGGGKAKVMDFGIARQAKQTLSQISHGISGTIAYMSPEQHLGQEKEPADIYAFGICAYRMLSGALPFKDADCLRQKENAQYAALSTLVPGLPPGLDRVIARVLSPDPAKRHASAAEFLADFEKHSS